jgi:hypothetical protein
MKYYLPQSKETPTIKVESSPVWEVILGMAGYTHSKLRHTFDFDDKWKKDSQSMPHALTNAMNWIEDTNFWYTLIMIQNKLSAETIQDFSNSLNQLTPDEFYETVLPYKDRHSENTRTSLAVSMLDSKLLHEYAEKFDGHEFLKAYILNLSAIHFDELRDLLLSSVQEWFAWISKKEEWSKWGKALQYESSLGGSLDESNPIEEIMRITGGVHYIPEPSIWTIKLIPHVSYRPWVMEQRTSDTKLFFYPIKEEYLLEPGIPGKELINGHKALGDETRLKLLYELVKGPLSLQDISGRFNISKTTVHHQLSILKAAKFIRADKGIYSANEPQIHSLSHKLHQFLGTRQ